MRMSPYNRLALFRLPVALLSRNRNKSAEALQRFQVGARAGFTLVEVAMALGIFAFAIIPVIGLMGTGLKASKESIDASTTTQIFRQAEAVLATNASVTDIYFSNEGEKLANASGAVYQAVMSAVTPNDAAQGLLVRKMWRVKIVRASAPSAIFSTRAIQVSQDISTSDFQ